MDWELVKEAEEIGRKIEDGENVTEAEILKALLILLLDFNRRTKDW